MTNFQRSRAMTIAVPLPTMRKLDGSLERIRQPFRSSALAPIALTEENSDEENKSSSSSLPPPPPPDPMNLPKESLNEIHWLFNRRFLLFCFSNFALCLVMGVPYVIIPTYISETFLDQPYLASWTLSNVGIASALGQILLGYLHDRKIFSAWLMYTFAVTLSGVSLVIIALFRYKLIVLICAFMYGLAISANYVLQVLIVIDALSMDNMANAFGILQFCQGVSTLIGIPVQGIYRYTLFI
jgi:predicted MFS family arabinose efflux permease